MVAQRKTYTTVLELMAHKSKRVGRWFLFFLSFFFCLCFIFFRSFVTLTIALVLAKKWKTHETGYDDEKIPRRAPPSIQVWSMMKNHKMYTKKCIQRMERGGWLKETEWHTGCDWIKWMTESSFDGNGSKCDQRTSIAMFGVLFDGDCTNIFGFLLL